MKIAIASDHAGFLYKEKIKIYLIQKGHEVSDFGTTGQVSVDYPDFIQPAARAVASGACERGIVLGGSGNGEAMAANRFKGVRCAVCWSEQTAKWAREHNDANMISIGERTIDEATAIDIVRAWLE
ncbi:MAG: RpiB/LacA/LacB family sugar-phosphate isomerase, partial [Ignavibacteriota bacterium]